MTLTVGQIAYLNCAPYFHYLRAAGFDGQIVSGVPARLNQLLASGEIDLSPASSFEYARHWRNYQLLPGLGISSFGPVRSVLLFSPVPPAQLGRSEVLLTAESATSVNLLQVLLREYLGGEAVRFRREAGLSGEEVIRQGGAALLIGDRALRAAREQQGTTGIYDLGELWRQATGLPFVFALWIVRRLAVTTQPAAVIRLQQQLQHTLQRAASDYPALAAALPERTWMGEAGLVEYWQQMSYTLGAEHLDGLRLFFRLCVKYGLLAEEPLLEFVEAV